MTAHPRALSLPTVDAARRRLLDGLPAQVDWTELELLNLSGLPRAALRDLLERLVLEGLVRRSWPFETRPSGARYRAPAAPATTGPAPCPADVERVRDALRRAPDTAFGLARRLNLGEPAVRNVLDVLQHDGHATARFVGLLAVYRHRDATGGVL